MKKQFFLQKILLEKSLWVKVMVARMKYWKLACMSRRYGGHTSEMVGGGGYKPKVRGGVNEWLGEGTGGIFFQFILMKNLGIFFAKVHFTLREFF